MRKPSNFEIKDESGEQFGPLNPNIKTIVDKETGVNYILITTSSGVAITPRLDKYGVYVSKEN